MGLFCYWKSGNLAKIVIFTPLDSTDINKEKHISPRLKESIEEK